LKVLCKGLNVDDQTLYNVARITEGYTPADLKLVVEEVKRELLKEGASTGVLRTQVTFNDFVKVLSQVKPSVSPEQIKVYEEFKNRKW